MTKFSLCAISGNSFCRESVLTALVPKKCVAQPVGSINIDQKVGSVVEDKNEISAYKGY